MRYKINFDKMVNQLVPHYIGGRKLILYLQALVSPLRVLNEEFVDWSKETRIEASMTSQVFKFEWFLNRKFSGYFANPSSRITISNGGDSVGLPLYWQSENINETAFYMQDDDVQESVEDNPAIYYSGEEHTSSLYSFVVHAPHPDTDLITQTAYDRQLRYWIDRYRLASKTYNIQYQD